MTEILVSKQILEYLKRDYGSHFSATETPGGYLVKVNDPEVQHELEMALKIMGEYEETLRILTK